MDFKERAASVIKNLSAYKNESGNIHYLISNVCALFDIASRENLSLQDYRFLRFIASEIGIPQYYDLLCAKKKITGIELSLSDVLAVTQDAPLCVSENVFLHRYQKEIFACFVLENQNRYFLSAPTSFGKTYIIYEIIKKMAYDNVVLIFPTIALLGENYLKLLDLRKKSDFWAQYSVHTLSDEETTSEKNLWIYTPERFMSFIDKHRTQQFDFIFIDEIYKIDNQYIIDVETVGENERDISFRIALFDTCLRAKDILLAGPYITFPNEKCNRSLEYFLLDNAFTVLNYNNIEIVNKSFLSVQEKKDYSIDDLFFSIKSKEKRKKLLTVLKSVDAKNANTEEGTIVYCCRKIEAESLAKYLVKNIEVSSSSSQDMVDFIDHLSAVFGDEWIVIQALRHGVGIHHGLVPKYIQREIISLFNNGDISVLLSTTTITEGINTTAKNVIVMSDMKGTKVLKHFDAQNIAGRAGRFNSHYSGRVIAIDNNFMTMLLEDGECLTHRGYDITSSKSDVDLEITNKDYLSTEEKLRKANIARMVAESGLPDEIINSFKAISKVDKITLYKKLEQLTHSEKQGIEYFCRQLFRGAFDWNGFDIICHILASCVKEEGLQSMMTQQIANGHFLLTPKVYFYLKDGFLGVIENEKTYYKRSVDSSIREASKMVFNTFRYQLSKYLGVFDLLYRYCIAAECGIDIDQVLGLNILIQLLEYGSVVEKAKKANDYGVPYSIVRYYETEDSRVVKTFDPYETKVFNRIKDIL